VYSPLFVSEPDCLSHLHRWFCPINLVSPISNGRHGNTFTSVDLMPQQAEWLSGTLFFFQCEKDELSLVTSGNKAFPRNVRTESSSHYMHMHVLHDKYQRSWRKNARCETLQKTSELNAEGILRRAAVELVTHRTTSLMLPPLT